MNEAVFHRQVGLGRLRIFGLVLVGVALFTGCLPYSCQRQANEALYPSDSLSRRVAQNTPVDTLRRIWASSGTEDHFLTYPRTVRVLDSGSVVVSDAERNSLFSFARDGTLEREITDEAFAVPYLTGTRGDTLVVFNAEADRIDLVVDGVRLAGRSLSIERPTPETLVYMLATDTGLYAKVVGQTVDPFITRLDASGHTQARVSLQGPYWRHAGFLRTWGDTLVSLSGYRPTVELLPMGFPDGATADSLALVGFDSPMLERSYAFGQGEASQAPLLTPSAAAVGDTLFVLNLRPGWVQIDAYGRNGRLRRRLVEPHETGNPNFYPLDLDVRRTSPGYLFAVAVRSPDPRIELFRWSLPSSKATAE